MNASNKYKELSKFNLTRLIESLHNDKIVLPKDFIEKINFHEKSKHNFMLDNQMRNVDETLAINCISNLPFEVYKPYISPNWIINKDLNESMIEQFNYHGSYEFLEYLLDICIEHNKTIPPSFKDRTTEESDFHRKYNEKFLEMLINLERIVGRVNNPSKEYVNNNYKLFKKALKEKFEYIGIQNKLMFSEKENPKDYNIEEWFKHYDYINYYSESKKTIENFIKDVVTRENNIDIFLDIDKQYNNSPDNPLRNKEVLLDAFYARNNKVVKALSPYITKEDKIDIFYKVCNKWSENMIKEFNHKLKEEDSEIEYKYEGKVNDVKWYIQTINKLVPDHEINWKKTEYLLIGVNEQYFNELSIEYPKIKTEELLYSLNVEQIALCINIADDFIETYNYPQSYRAYDKITYHFMKHIASFNKEMVNLAIERNEDIKSITLHNCLSGLYEDYAQFEKKLVNFESFWEIINLNEELENKVPNKHVIKGKKL